MTTRGPTVLTDRDGPVLTVILNRPDQLNAFTVAMHRELADALSLAESDDSVRVVVLTGAGRAFCAGQALDDPLVAPGADLGAMVEEHYNPLVSRLRRLPKPVLAAVNGTAAGAGANLALACDIVVAARSARFSQPFTRLDLVPDSGGSWLLPRLVGPARAAGLALLGEPLPAEQAAVWGLIWRAVDDSDLATTVRDIADRLAALPPGGLAATKRALSAAWNHDLDTHLRLERDLQRVAGAGRDYREAVTAFLARAGRRHP